EESAAAPAVSDRVDGGPAGSRQAAVEWPLARVRTAGLCAPRKLKTVPGTRGPFDRLYSRLSPESVDVRHRQVQRDPREASRPACRPHRLTGADAFPP